MTAIADEVVVPNRPDLRGLRFRRFRGPDDFPGMVAANQAGRDAAGIEEVVTVASIAHRYAHLVNSDPATDMVVVERHDTVIGYARVEWRDLVDGTRDLQTTCVVHPSEQDQGIGAAMLAWQEARLREIAPTLPDADTRPTRLGSYTWGGDRHATSLLEANGWGLVARGYEMVRATLDDIPDLQLPAGLEIRAVTPTDRERVWHAAVDAFRDHRAEPVMEAADLMSWLADTRQDPELWVVAYDGNEVAGSVLGLIDEEENKHHGRARGLIDEVSTRAAWRRRGLARALIALALVRLRDHGMTSAYLGVDGANPNQAMTLYESMGFKIASTSTDWSKPL